MPVNPIPEGYRSITPYLCIAGAAKAIDFYTQALGAKEIARMPGPEDKLMHAEIRIGDSMIMLSDEFAEMGNCKSPKSLGATSCSIMIYVPDCDRIYKQAVDAGARGLMPPADMFWGDRMSQIVDPFGHVWSIATHVEDVSPDQVNERAAAFMAGADGHSV